MEGEIMRNIKQKKITLILISIIFLLSMVSSLLPIVSASNYTITIKEKLFEETDTKTVGINTIKIYTITVILENEGTEISDNMTVEILGDNMSVNKYNYIMPGESKAYIFTDYPSNSEEIAVNYYPADNNIDKTSANSGNTTIKLNANGQTTETTPYINIIFMFSIILFISYVLKKGRKRI